MRFAVPILVALVSTAGAEPSGAQSMVELQWTKLVAGQPQSELIQHLVSTLEGATAARALEPCARVGARANVSITFGRRAVAVSVSASDRSLERCVERAVRAMKLRPRGTTTEWVTAELVALPVISPESLMSRGTRVSKPLVVEMRPEVPHGNGGHDRPRTATVRPAGSRAAQRRP